MIPLTCSVAILYEHARLTRLKSNAPLLAALDTAACRHIILILTDEVALNILLGRRVFDIASIRVP